MRAARLVCAFIIIAAAAFSQELFAWEASTGQDDLRGKPKTVKVEREADGKRRPEQQTDYRPDGKTAEHRVWKEDGTLSTHEVYAYDKDGRRSTITYFDDKGNKVRTQTFRHPDANTEEETDDFGGTTPGTHTTRRFDDHGRMIEMNDGDMSATMTYDEQGRPTEAVLKPTGHPGILVRNGNVAGPAPEGAAMRVQIHYETGNKALVTMYGADGNIALQVESTEDGAGGQMARLLFSETERPGQTGITQDNERDAQGNWTRRTELRRNPNTQVDEPVAVLYRTITYY